MTDLLIERDKKPATTDPVSVEAMTDLLSLNGSFDLEGSHASRVRVRARRRIWASQRVALKTRT